MDVATTTRRLAQVGPVMTDLQRSYYDDQGQPTSQPRLVPRQISCVVGRHVISVSYNGREQQLCSRAHVVRVGERSDPMTDYFPGSWVNLKTAIAIATREG